MNKNNIHIGIDLGTTNSELVIKKGESFQVIKNIRGDDYTPSVFGIDKSGNRIIGQRAYEKLRNKNVTNKERQNYIASVKRLMGSKKLINLPRARKGFKAEEVSAEILKSLKSDLLRRYPDFKTNSVVITVPAAFDMTAKEATKRAGRIAGFEYITLLQEPLAAAISYGFNKSENSNWLVYDLGGGTFDVAFVSSNDGVLDVSNHNGDNHLGGKDFDKLITNEIIVPEIQKKYGLSNFNRNNSDYNSTFAYLDKVAEDAKKYLSQYQVKQIEVDTAGIQDNKNISLEIEISRDEFKKLIKPYVKKTIDLTQKTIKESGVKEGSIERIVLVGGSTLIPYIKNALRDKFHINVDSSLNPHTAIARGACIYGISHKVPDKYIVSSKNKIDSNAKKLSLKYDSVTADKEETISGVIEGLKGDEDYYIKIQRDDNNYVTDKIKLDNGKFIDSVTLRENKTNKFWVYLINERGDSLKVEPEYFEITQGVKLGGIPISKPLGVAVRKTEDVNINSSGNILPETEKMEIFFKKNENLPLEKSKVFKTVKTVRKGEGDNICPIKVFEGESMVPDNNKQICMMNITGKQIPHNLPKGSEIEVTLRVDNSETLTLEVYIPSLDWYDDKQEDIRTIYDEEVDINTVKREFKDQKEDIKKIESTCTKEEQESLGNLCKTVKRSINNAKESEEEKRKARSKLRNLKNKIEKLKKKKKFPELKKEFNKLMSDVKKIKESVNNKKKKSQIIEQINVLEEEGEQAISKKDKDLLSNINQQIRQIVVRVLVTNTNFLKGEFRRIKSMSDQFLNKDEAQKWIQKGEQAISNNNRPKLVQCIQALAKQLPDQAQSRIKKHLSGITKKNE